MMMVPAANISASSTPSTTATATAAAAAAGSSCSSSSAKLKGVMLHQHQQQDLQQQRGAAAGAAALKCPRCDSSNTKFCYYNNYSLSQPRHFCKACKRYWTRGGTLRNVPIGGGCRKNKRVKKSSQQQQQQQSVAATSTGSAAVAADPPRSSSLVSRSLPASATNDLSSFLYPDMNLAAFSSTGTAAYEALGLGGLIPTSQLSATELINNNLADLQQQAASFLNNDYSTSFRSQAASLLVSSPKQPKKAEEYQSLLPYDGSADLGFLKDVKVEGDNNLMGNNNVSTEWQASYPFEANGASDASYLYWNSVMGGAGGWPDAANPSIAPLI